MSSRRFLIIFTVIAALLGIAAVRTRRLAEQEADLWAQATDPMV